MSKIVTVKAQGVILTGKVDSAVNCGTTEAPNWYVEFTSPTGKYHYYKQKFDGGTCSFEDK